MNTFKIHNYHISRNLRIKSGSVLMRTQFLKFDTATIVDFHIECNDENEYLMFTKIDNILFHNYPSVSIIENILDIKPWQYDERMSPNDVVDL